MNDTRPDIEQVFDYYGRRILPTRGDWSKAECPLIAHEDRNPSASVNTDTGKWQCWSCGNHGDAFDIILSNEESCAGFADAKRFAESHFGTSNSSVRGGPVGRSGLSVRPGGGRSSGTFVPPWNRAF